MKRSLFPSIAFLIFGGCATNTLGVPPSQNSSLSAISPSETSLSKGGIMQKGLDSWLKEEWRPLSEPTASTAPTPSSSAQEANKVIEDENGSFTLQHYANKWKMYHKNKEKKDEGKAKEASGVEKLEKLPVIGV